ncbi:MAG: CoA ester lyase [Gordonia sp.]|nr:CoA ester lyase [Gordonia sp. (in: high G+C Gram-positive bacteria)]
MISREAICDARSFLFVPGNRPERFSRAADAGAGAMIIDLEDAVAPHDKTEARQAAIAWFSGGGEAILRINEAGTAWHADDIELASELSASVMVPKAEEPESIQAIANAIGGDVIPLIETSAGLMAAAQIAREGAVARMAFGSIDLAAELGTDPADRESLLFARSTLVHASAAAKMAPPIDGVTTALHEPTTLADDVAYAARLGFSAKLCIHPKQLPVVHKHLAPNPGDIEWAERIVTAAAGTDGSAFAIDGQMVDAPVVARARRILGELQ